MLQAILHPMLQLEHGPLHLCNPEGLLQPDPHGAKADRYSHSHSIFTLRKTGEVPASVPSFIHPSQLAQEVTGISVTLKSHTC